jgi:hypothetical protein
MLDGPRSVVSEATLLAAADPWRLPTIVVADVSALMRAARDTQQDGREFG